MKLLKITFFCFLITSFVFFNIPSFYQYYKIFSFRKIIDEGIFVNVKNNSNISIKKINLYFNNDNTTKFCNLPSLGIIEPNSEVCFHNFISSKNTPSNLSPGVKITLSNDKVFNFKPSYVPLKSSRYFVNLEIFNTDKNIVLLKTKLYNKSLLFPFDDYIEKEIYL